MSRQRPLRDLVIYCDRPSDTARELSKRLTARRLFGNTSKRLRNLSGSLVVNYGTSHSPSYRLGDKSVILNKPEAIAKAISKRVSYAAFAASNVPTLEFTTDRELASQWVRDGSGVLARRDGLSSGKGIVFVPKGSQSAPDADFYTKYFAKTHEYRAHVFRGRLIDLTQKRLQNGQAKGADADSVEKIVRSLDNGWVHAHQFELADGLRQELERISVQALASLGLDFGAVDILAKYPKAVSGKTPVFVVCEVNTAPGLGNEVTLKAYTDAIRAEYTSSADARRVVIARARRKRVKRQMLVTIVTRKGNKVKRMRDRWVYEDTGELVSRQGLRDNASALKRAA
jgi:hypothetical protein